MAKKWYVVHTYSGFENKVKKSLEERARQLSLARTTSARSSSRWKSSRRW